MLSIAFAWNASALSLSLTFIGPASPGNSGLIRLTITTTKSNMYQPFVTKSQNQFAKILPASSTDREMHMHNDSHDSQKLLSAAT